MMKNLNHSILQQYDRPTKYRYVKFTHIHTNSAAEQGWNRLNRSFYVPKQGQTKKDFSKLSTGDILVSAGPVPAILS
jgi:hypothetical protein